VKRNGKNGVDSGMKGKNGIDGGKKTEKWKETEKGKETEKRHIDIVERNEKNGKKSAPALRQAP